MNTDELNVMTGQELTVIYNGLIPEDKQLKKWSGKKSTLVDRIIALDISIDFKDKFNGIATTEVWIDEADIITKEGTADLRFALDLPKPITEDNFTEELDKIIIELETKTPSKRTIRLAAIEHLCFISYYEDKTLKASTENVVEANHEKARSVGIPYNEVLNLIQDEFEGCETSIACLRWYGVKIRAQELGYSDYTMCQRRPRVKKVK